MAKDGTGLKRRRNRRRSSTGLPRGFAMGVLLLVCVGLVAWYFRSEFDSLLSPKPRTESSAKAGTSGGKAMKGKPEAAAPPAEASDSFEFYDVLPDAEVEVTEQPKSAGPGGPPPVSVPGTYVVQAGAFPNVAEADKVKARLALLGIVAEIQSAEANGELFHRVRIGPVENLDELNRLRAQLRQNGIEYLVIPVGE
ncbi:MAG: SPOR domain-containing protein [Gammaproteobacteria bacterium]